MSEKANVFPVYHLTNHKTDYAFLSFAKENQWRESYICWRPIPEGSVPEWAKKREADRVLKYS